MKLRLSVKRERGFTLIELLLLIAAIVILAMLIDIGPPTMSKSRALRVQCINNLKQDGLAARVWAGDNGGKFPWEIAQTNDGTIESTSGPNLWRQFQVMSNELTTPKLLICPADERTAATNFTFFNNSNISYFFSLDGTNGSPPQMILSGDRNLTNGTPIENGILKLIPNHAAGWTAELHNKVGNILLADGSVQQLSTANLRITITHDVAVTNRLLMPVLSQ